VEQLAVLAGRGDREALGELVRQLQAPVWRFAHHLTGDRDLADEAAQETWVRAVRSLPRFRGVSSVLTWLLAIAPCRADWEAPIFAERNLSMSFIVERRAPAPAT